MSMQMKRLLIVLLAAIVAFATCSCSSIVELEKQAIISAVGIDKGENKKFKVSAQVFQSMGAGSSTPVDSSQTNTIIVSAEGDTIAQCMNDISYALGRDINIGHSKFIVIGKDALSIPFSESLDYFLRSEQTYLGVPIISSKTTARDILDVKLKNEVETAIAVENIIRTAVENGNALETDLLSIANSVTAALPIVEAQKPPKKDDKEKQGNSEEEDTKLVFSGTQIVHDGKIVYTATAEETMAFCWLEGKLDKAQLCLAQSPQHLNVNVTLIRRSSTIRKINGEYVMIYKIRAKVKLLDSFKPISNGCEICMATKQQLEEMCSEAFAKLTLLPNGDFIGVEKIAKSVYPVAALHDDDIFENCGISVEVECAADK